MCEQFPTKTRASGKGLTCTPGLRQRIMTQKNPLKSVTLYNTTGQQQ